MAAEHLLSNNVHARIVYAGSTAAATTTIDSAVIDMAGYQGLMLHGSIGATATDNGIDVLCSTSSSTAQAEDLLNSRLQATSTALLVDVYPWPVGKRYAFGRIIRTTSATIGALHAIKYKARRAPVDNATSTQAVRQLANPSTGQSTST